MSSPAQRNNTEEARKELLATMQASRELGPEMDDTLSDRFMEKLATLRPANSFDKTATRAKLESLLQSARGSDSAADATVADSFLTNIPPARLDPQPYAYPGAPGQVEYGPLVRYRNPDMARLAPMIVCAAILIVALVVSGGHLWWLIFFLPAAFGMGRRGQYQQQRRLQREQWRAQRHDRILNRDDVNNPRLPPQRPPEIL
jgi:hypothetical protein